MSESSSYIHCHKCGERAAVRMKHHRLQFCKDHYIEWFQQQTLRTIRKYHMFTPKSRVLVAVSGGKDSLALWDVLHALGFNADGFYIDLGIDGGFGYSSQSKALTQSFAESRGLNLIIHEVAKEYGESIPEITARSRRGKDKPCAVCGLVKRHVMNEITLKGNYDIVATGHNLDDEAAALFSNTLHWNTGLLARQAPVLESAHGFPGKVKPFCRFYERETAAYTILRGIDYIYDECPFSDGSTSLYYKTILNQMEERSIGAKLHFYTHFLKAKEENFFNKPPLSEEDSAIHPCVVCGQPTHRKDRCAFCQLFVSQD